MDNCFGLGHKLSTSRDPDVIGRWCFIRYMELELFPEFYSKLSCPMNTADLSKNSSLTIKSEITRVGSTSCMNIS